MRADTGDGLLKVVDRPGVDDAAGANAVAVLDHYRRYVVDAFVARYAAAWAYGVVGSTPSMSEDYYQGLHRTAAECLDPQGGPVLDVGCGPGRTLADLAPRYPSVRFVGVDRSPAMTDLARRILCGPATTSVDLDASDYGFAPVQLVGLGLPNVEVYTAAVETLSARQQRYQLVIASHLLDRVQQPAVVLDRLLELVAHGGNLLVSCAFNYETRQQWTSLPSQALARRVESAGYRIEVLDDDVPYREQLDARGTWTHHRVLVLRARRP